VFFATNVLLFCTIIRFCLLQLFAIIVNYFDMMLQYNKYFSVLHHNKILFATIATWLVSSEETRRIFFFPMMLQLNKLFAIIANYFATIA
jgi:hypothetical protein